MTGTPGADVISGLNGNDAIGGNDVICAGGGADSVFGPQEAMCFPAGPDELTGTAGVDVIAGLNGDDDIAGLGGQ